MAVRGRDTLCTSPEVCSLLRDIFVSVCERDWRRKKGEDKDNKEQTSV